MSTAVRSAAARPAPAAAAPIRLMIVDDSQVARAVLTRMLAAQRGFAVVAQAGNAAEAIGALRSVAVDVVLLDLEMPGASGLEALPAILREGRGARVLIVSSLCEAGAEATVRALALGPTDTLPKPGTGAFGGGFAEVLAEKLRAIAGAELERSGEAEAGLVLRPMPEGRLDCIAVGASTGGLRALNDFLKALPARTGATILVTQHLPALFMPVFARQLAASGRSAAVARDGDTPSADRILVAPGDAHLRLERRGSGVAVRLCGARAASGCRPSVDPMLASVAQVYGPGGLGVMLGGMGRGGLGGARLLVESGGAMLAQDRRSAAVWGMPRGVAEAGLASAVLAPADLARRTAPRLGAGPC